MRENNEEKTGWDKRKYYLDNKEKILEVKRNWNAANRARVNEYNRKWRAENPEKNSAHKAVERAIKSNKLTRMACEVCGSKRTEAHHDDYNKPLEVRWLCTKHHVELHRLLDIKES